MLCKRRSAADARPLTYERDVVAAHNVQAQGHRLHGGAGGVDALVAALQDDVDGVVVAAQTALRTHMGMEMGKGVSGE
jgi:predicted dinucleotide-utilizing enzyme